MANALPAIGTFIRPVGAFRYCYSIKVCHVFPDSGRVQGERCEDRHADGDERGQLDLFAAEAGSE